MDAMDTLRHRPRPDNDGWPKDSPILPAASFERVFTWEQAIRVLRKRGALMFGVAATLTVLVSFYAASLKNFYQPTARIEIDTMDSGIKTLQEIQYSSGVPDPDYLETQAQILRSEALGIRVIRALHLDQYAEFVGKPAPASRSAVQRPQSPIATMPPSYSLVADPSDLAERTPLESAALGVFENNLAVNPVRGSRLLEVMFTSHDPALAQLITNTLVTQFIEQNYRNRYTSTMEASDWLSTQLNDLRRKVDESTRAAAAYQDRYGLVEADDHDVPQTQLMSETNHQLSNAQADRIEAEAYVRMIDLGQEANLPPLREDTVYQTLTTRFAEIQSDLAKARAVYGDENSNVKKLLGQADEMATQLVAERGRIVDRLRASYEAARSRETMLAQNKEKLRARMGQDSSHLMEYQQLKNEAMANAELYNTLQARLKEAGIFAGLRSSNIHVVDFAPRLVTATGPHRKFIIAVGVIGSCLFALALAFVRESFENTIRTPDDVREWVGLPTLAMLPAIGRARNWQLGTADSPVSRNTFGGGDSPQGVLNRVQLAECEGMRGLRTSISVLLNRKGVAPCVVLVSSALMGEGKTTVSMNLAEAFARRGRKSLLIDADLRRPRIAEYFGVKSEPGLTDLLNNNAKADDAIVDVPLAPGLSILPSGRAEADPADLMSEERMQELLRGIKDRFNFIVVDSPPVILFSEARLLSLVSDVVILVGRYGFTTQRAINRGVQLLEEVHAPIAGVVLNDIDISSADYHYYNYGFGRGMSNKYGGYPPERPTDRTLPPSATGGDVLNMPDSSSKSRGAHA